LLHRVSLILSSGESKFSTFVFLLFLYWKYQRN
jgi:hypothetical protein